MVMRPAALQLTAFLPLVALGLLVAASPVDATELGAIMMGGAAFFNSNEVDQVAEELNFKSLSPGLDGGVFLQMGPPRQGVSFLAGIGVFWSRRKHPTDFTNEQGDVSSGEGAFRLTSLSLPITAVYSFPTGAGRFYAGGGAAYYVATVTAESDVTGSNWFPSDGTTSRSGSRSADGPGYHLIVGYEHPSPIGGIGGGVFLRHAKFPTDPASGVSNFDVDLSGISVFISLSVRASKPDPNQAP